MHEGGSAIGDRVVLPLEVEVGRGRNPHDTRVSTAAREAIQVRASAPFKESIDRLKQGSLKLMAVIWFALTKYKRGTIQTAGYTKRLRAFPNSWILGLLGQALKGDTCYFVVRVCVCRKYQLCTELVARRWRLRG